MQAQIRTPGSKPSATLPANPPTSSSTVASATPPAPLTPSQQPARRAEVKYTDGQLAVTADNSSLNQILREIGRETGIKITGGVAEERVYGTYGPGSTATVLAALLDGTESNMLLLENDKKSPEELVLTPRHGGPTPPNPNAPGFDDDNSAESPATTQRSRLNPPPSQEPGEQREPSAATPPTSVPGDPSTAAGGASDPNGVKTPQQIYEQLQQMQKQHQPQTPQ